MTIEDEGKDLEFELRPNNQLVSPDFVVVVRSTEGVVRERGVTKPSCVFSGTAKGNPDITAALSDCDGRGFVSIMKRNE